MADPKSLTDKLKQADGKGLTLAFAQQVLEYYWIAVSDLLGDGCFNDIYRDKIKPYMKEEPELICRFLHQLPRTKKRTEILYQVLIEPFIAMRAADGIDDKMEDDKNDTDDN